MYTGDDLTNFWGLVAAGIGMLGLGSTLSHRIWRPAGLGCGALLAVAGIFWGPLKRTIPAIGPVFTATTHTPGYWIALVALMVAALWLHQWRKETIELFKKLGANAPGKDSRANTTTEVEQRISKLQSEITKRLTDSYETTAALEEQVAKKLAAIPPEPTKPSVNWAIWRARENYTIAEFASILAKEDPLSKEHTLDQHSFELLLIEAVQHQHDEDPQHFLDPDVTEYTKVKRQGIIAWAKGKGFDVSHVE